MKLKNIPKLCACGDKNCKLSPSQKLLIKYQGKDWPDYKKVVDAVTGKAYKIPVTYIIKHKLTFDNLPLFAEWPPNTPGAAIFS